MRKKKWLKRLAAALVVLLILFVLASNIVVDLALVPEKMEQTQAFEDITEDSYEALVQTDDIEQNKCPVWRRQTGGPRLLTAKRCL